MVYKSLTSQVYVIGIITKLSEDILIQKYDTEAPTNKHTDGLGFFLFLV